MSSLDATGKSAGTIPSTKVDDESQQEEEIEETLADDVAYEFRTLKLRIIASEEFTSLPGWEKGAPKVISETDYQHLISLCQHQIRALKDFKGCLDHASTVQNANAVFNTVGRAHASIGDMSVEEAKTRLEAELAKWAKWQRDVLRPQSKAAAAVWRRIP